jgi:hypothetical protein
LILRARSCAEIPIDQFYLPGSPAPFTLPALQERMKK